MLRVLEIPLVAVAGQTSSLHQGPGDLPADRTRSARDWARLMDHPPSRRASAATEPPACCLDTRFLRVAREAHAAVFANLHRFRISIRPDHFATPRRT